MEKEIFIYVFLSVLEESIRKFSGDNNDEEIPVSIPNTEVKLISAEDTCGIPYWENRLLPDLYSSLAQLVERPAVKQISKSKVSSSIRKLIDEKVANSVKLVTSKLTTIPSKAKAMCRDFIPPT